MKNLAILTHKNEGGKFRAGVFVPFLEKSGVSVTVIEISSLPIVRIKTFWALRNYDVTVIQKKLLSAFDLFIIRHRAKRIVFDFDDAIFCRSSRHKRQNSWSRMRRFAGMIGSVDAVIAGNTYLADQAARFISRDRIFVVPTIVDVTNYGIKESEKESVDFVIGWIGSGSTLHYLASIAPAIRAAGKRVKNLKLKIVCNGFFDIDGVEVIKKPWRPQDVSSDLMSFDVGVMPISDDPWTRGKCGFKIVQYLAAGIPAVVSPVGINRDLVIPGATGLWAESLHDWEERLLELAEDKKKRTSMGRAGRRLVERQFSLQAVSPRYLEILETVEKMGKAHLSREDT